MRYLMQINACEVKNILVLLIECIIGIILFTLIVVPMTLSDPLRSIGDYPPAIREKCIELGLIPKTEKRFSGKEIIKKIIAMIIFIPLFSFIIYKFNGADTFLKGFVDSYIIWSVITWYDAVVLDCIWFCHSKKVKIKGTENMKEYKDYLFHIKQSCIGMLLGLPVCASVGALTMIV